MDKFKEKLAGVRAELDTAIARTDAAEAEVKRLQDDNTQKDHDITSLKNKLAMAEENLSKAEDRIAANKLNLDEGETTKTVGEGLMRKVSLLETELDAAERNLRETTEKLRLMDVKAEQFERKVTQLEGEKAAYEVKVEELNEKYDTVKKEMEATMAGLEEM